MADDLEREWDLEDRLIDFAVLAMGVAEALPETRAGRQVEGQIIRCGTSPAPSYGEAQSAESRNDFIHKMKVCLKELRETRIWLLIIQRKPLIEPAEKLDPVIAECAELLSCFQANLQYIVIEHSGQGIFGIHCPKCTHSLYAHNSFIGISFNQHSPQFRIYPLIAEHSD